MLECRDRRPPRAIRKIWKREGFGRLSSTLLLLVVMLATAGAASAQEDPATDAPEPAPPLSVSIAAAARTVQDSALIAIEQIDEISQIDALRTSLYEARARQEELAGMLQVLTAVEHTRPERLFRLRDLALANEQRLQQHVMRLTERLGALADLRAEWLSRLARHSSWQQAVEERPELSPQLPEIRRSMAIIRDVLERIEAVEPAVAGLEEEARQLQSTTRLMLDEIAAVRAGRRAALLRRDQPLLLSPAHLRSLRQSSAWIPTEAMRGQAISAFVREHGGLLLLHVVLIVGFGLLARWLRRHTLPEAGWSGLLLHPWAFSTFAVTAFLTRRYILSPPLWDVVIWTLLAASGAMLAPTLLRGRALRMMLIAVAAMYPLLLLGEALRLPAPIFRLGIAGAAGAATIGFPLLALWSLRVNPAGRNARIALGIASVISAAVLVSEILGFDQLARWLVHAALTSAFVILAIGLLIVVGRGALRTLLRKEFIGRVRMVGTVAVPLAERLLFLLQILLVIGGALVLLDVWELAPAPMESWNLLIDWGFQLAGVRITMGRVLLAVLLVYLALTASWLARTLVNEQVSRGWALERGVADSIITLVHYAVITVGVFMALGALGVELQNFAIVAGALGVGIGFGLQTVVNNFVSGLILLFERPVRVGDTVEMEGEWGTIKKIGLRSTVVTNFTQAEVIVPNADLVSQKVTNWTLTNPVTRVTMPVGVAYGSDVQKVLEILVEAGSVHPSIATEPSPMALFMGFGDNSLDFELRVWVTDVVSRLPARSVVLAEIDRRFREAKIEIPFPQRDLHIRSVAPDVARAVLSPRKNESPPSEG